MPLNGDEICQYVLDASFRGEGLRDWDQDDLEDMVQEVYDRACEDCAKGIDDRELFYQKTGLLYDATQICRSLKHAKDQV